MRGILVSLVLLCALGLIRPPAGSAWGDSFGNGANTFNIDFVTIGNPGNPADTRFPNASPNPAGSVANTYRIGEFEISEQMIDKANTLGGLGVTKDTRGADKPATSVLLVRSGDAAPGTPTGTTFQSLFSIASTPFPPQFNLAGQSAFTATLTGQGITQGTNNTGIWVGKPGNVTLIARQGDQAAGMQTSIKYGSFGPIALNDLGEVTFQAFTVSGPGEGVWEGAPGSLRVSAAKGAPAPGTANGVVFTSFGEDTINAAGAVAFGAGLSGPGVVGGANDGGIWSERTGQLTLVARKGDQAPGTPAGVLFTGFFSPILNSIGQTAFYARLTGPGITSANNEGIWAQGQSGQLHLIVRVGDQLELGPTDFRTINQLSFPTGFERSGGGLSGFNDSGQVAFYARFAGASAGVFVSNTVAVPEPLGAVLSTLGLLPLLVLFRRTRLKRLQVHACRQ